ncbi:transcriptional regulator, AsnC family domain protein [Pseudarthrobacter siccitolerans]|uniref:Transcriptional regulator, AsnC family domain protein n=1 Tax=Pseudarthrobacter siccitolerans TaxID=861266 RepID=A0A024GWH0_9MICC|nr:transcriptional regulator, AsnC family domain protein [Pseudarthrobacter siccitolerans]
MQQRIPGIDLVESVVMLSTVKRVGWMLNRDSTATGRVIVPAAVARAR